MNNPHLYLSLVFILIFGFVLRRRKVSLFNTLILLFLTVASLLLNLFYFISDEITSYGIDESVIFHLKYGFNGSGFAHLSNLIGFSIIAVIAIGIFVLIVFIKKKDTAINSNKALLIFLYFVQFISILLNPAVHDLKNLYFVKTSSESFSEHYLKPNLEHNDKLKKNLIVIYAESMERTYFDPAIFPGLNRYIKQIKTKRIDFSNIVQVEYAHNTMGGIVASQCGVPLISTSHGNAMSGMDTFLQKAVCLGDLLHDQGYRLSFFGGADIRFAGKDKYFKTHNFDDVYGNAELLDRLPDKAYLNNWGLFDDSLLDIAYDSFIDQSKKDKPFGIFILTLGTHAPVGHVSQRCENKISESGSNKMLDAVSCSEYLIAEFIDKIAISPYAEKTVIVLQSDHLAMRNTAYELLNLGKRRNLFMIFDPQLKNSKEINRLGSTLDISPTVLPFIGFKGDVGLGRDLLDTKVKNDEVKLIHKNLKGWRKDALAFWEFPRIDEFIKIDLHERVVQIDERKFNIPALLRFDDAFKTTLIFNFNRFPRNKTLFDILEDDKITSHFLLIDDCAKMNKIDHNLGDRGCCAVLGTRGNYLKKWKLRENIKLSAHEIRDALQLGSNFKVQRVAHAGGAIDDRTYTNSLKAIDRNFKDGFLYFEIDFSFTSDNHLVCVHDFEGYYQKAKIVGNKMPPSLKEFNEVLDDSSDLKSVSFDDLVQWLENNLSATLITDVKGDNIQALKLISERMQDYENRVIPQIYEPENYSVVKKLGYNRVIWTLYRYKGTKNDILKWVNEFKGPFAVTMPPNLAKTDLPKLLAEMNIPTYVHTVNTEIEAEQFMGSYGISEIYTDNLLPKQ